MFVLKSGFDLSTEDDCACVSGAGSVPVLEDWTLVAVAPSWHTVCCSALLALPAVALLLQGVLLFNVLLFLFAVF